MPASGLYAHSVPDQDTDAWEPLSNHLAAVAARAAGFAGWFGFTEPARAAGLLHDIGKAAPGFQAYICGRGSSPDHSTAGAILAVERYGKGIGKLLAFGIAGHHAGLANGSRSGRQTSSLKDRLKAGMRVEPPTGIDLPAAEAVAVPFEGDDGSPFRRAFLARMLFSCLVDADFLETERFYLEAHGESPDRGCDVTLETLRGRLANHMATVRAGAEPGEVNALRAHVLDTVMGRAALPPGLFTLTVPTGGGKTLASLAFALEHAVRHGMRRVIHVIPFTSIVEQTADVFRRALEDDDAILEHHSAFDPEPARGTGKGADDEAADGLRKLRQAAENWDRPVVVTTAVQFFESLFAARTGRCRKLHNIARSVIVLDEAQTLPLKVLRPCLEALTALAAGYGCSVVLCTATQPAVRVEDGLKDGLSAVRELAPEPRDLYVRLKRVTVRRSEAPLSVQELAERMAGEPRILTIVNNRRHARDLFRALDGRDGVRVLTTALCAAHRRAVLAGVREDLRHDRPVRLIATSLVEAGVDLDFPVVYRAMAGLDSIAQAAGRCNRNGRLGREGGRVFVFSPADSDAHKPPPELSQFAEVAAEVLRTHGTDPLGLDTVTAYFADLYWQRELGGDWRAGTSCLDEALVGDRKGILAALLESGRSLDFPFADISDAFRIIDDTQRPVIVPYAPKAADIAELLDALRHAPYPGSIARALQPYTVQIPRSACKRLLEARAAKPVSPEKFGDQFLALDNPDLYDARSGLDWDDPYFRRVEGGIF